MKNILNFESFYNNKINEISSDLFKRSIDASRDRDYIGRTEKLGTLYFRDFIGKQIFEDGIIRDILIAAYKSSSTRLISIDIEYTNKNKIYHNDDPDYPKERWVSYNIDKDFYIGVDWKISRKDARILSRIAEKINPNTKYKESGRYFNIKGF